MEQIKQFKFPFTVVPVFLGVRNIAALQLVGLRHRMEGVPSKVVPKFWEKFLPYRGWLPGQKDQTLYGALIRSDAASSRLDYFTAVEVSDFERVGPDWDMLEVPQQCYVVFSHRNHVSELSQTQHAIFSQALPALNLTPHRHARNAPLVIERYEKTYNFRAGWGDIQIWVPIEDD